MTLFKIGAARSTVTGLLLAEIIAVIAAALAYGYWEHTKESRHLSRLFAVLAEKYQGQVKKARIR